MKYLLIRVQFFSILFSLVFAGYAFSMPVKGDWFQIQLGSHGIDNVGGEYKIDMTDSSKTDYISFCLEKNDPFSIGTQYQVESVADQTLRGTKLEDSTKWVYWNYIKGTFDDLFNANELAATVQHVIWFLQGEQVTLDSVFSFNWDAMLGSTTDYSITGNVKALNFYYRDNNDELKFGQSQIISEPVPEPATMLLFGVGLIGLAGLSYRRKKK